MNTRCDRMCESTRSRRPPLFSALIAAILLILVSTAGAAVNAATVTVPAGGNLQAALDTANPGDTIILVAGATYTGPFFLRDRGGAGTDVDYITIQSSALSQLPSSSVRISPSYAPQMPSILSNNNQPALLTSPYAHHYRFIGIEFRPQSQTAPIRNIIWLGDDGPSQTTLEVIPHHLTFDRCYIHAFANQDTQRAIALNSKETTIINCYISEIHSRSYDAQAVWGWNGPGPYHIINNYLEASGECAGFGGAVPSVPGVIPSDIEFRRDTFYKPVGWRSQGWIVKQLLELKSGQRVIIDGNVMEYNWVGSQAGFAIGLAPRTELGQAPWIQTRDIQITNNIIRHSGGAINILGKDDNYPSNQVTNVLIANNLFDDISGANWGGDGHFLQIANAAGVVLDHNTIFHTGTIINAWTVSSADYVMPGFVMKNNIVAHNAYGIAGWGVGNTTLQHFFPGAVVVRNVIAGADPSRYPRQDDSLPVSYYFPVSLDDVQFVNRPNGNYRLASSSPYKLRATDLTDVGADLVAIEAATRYTDTATATLPAAPSGAGIIQGGAYLGWADNSNNETGFKIERKLSGSSTYTQIATVGPNVTVYAVQPTAGVPDEFRVRATNALGDSAYAYSGCYACPYAWGAGSMVNINFQPADAAVPAGYLPDSGLPYADRGNGFSYGWDGENGGGARDRNSPASPDQRYDTLVAMQYSGNRTWEIAVPNGMYTVRVVAGDPDYYDSSHIYRINVECALIVNGIPSSGQRWVEGTQTVSVSDGKLTISNALGSSYNTLSFLEITRH